MKYTLQDNERFYIDSENVSYDVLELLNSQGGENIVLGKLVTGSGMISSLNFYKFLGTYSKKSQDIVETPDFSSTAETPDANKTYVDILTKKVYWYDANPSLLKDKFKELSAVNLSDYYTKTEVDSEISSKSNKVPQVTGTPAASVTIEPYKLYDFGTVSMSMTITFDTTKEIAGYTKEYIIRFVAGSGCAITLPNSVLYANGSTPTYVVGHSYEIDIVNDCAVVAEFY